MSRQPTRHLTAAIALGLVALLVIWDLARADLNPYQAPPLFALGSGQVASGGFCGALPD